MNLDADFFPALVTYAKGLNVDPEYVMRLFWLESRLDPAAHRSGSRYYGINQLDAAWLQKHGYGAADYLTWPASKQLTLAAGPFLAEAIHTYLKAPTIRSAGVLEALNLAPANVRDGAPGNVLYRKTVECVGDALKQNYYCANKGLDRNGSGTITISDIDTLMESFPKMGDWPLYQKAIVELDKARSTTTSPVAAAASTATPIIAGLALLGALGYGVYSYSRRAA